MNDRLDRLSKEEHTCILKEVVIPESGLDALTSQEHPKAIVLAGQPGAGKGSLARAARRELDFDVLVVDPDSQREYHPSPNAGNANLLIADRSEPTAMRAHGRASCGNKASHTAST